MNIETAGAVAAPRDMGNIEAQVGTLAELISSLDEELSRLYTRLNSVFAHRPMEAGKNPESNETTPSRSALADSLATRNDHLRGLIIFVRDMNQAVDL